MASKTGSQRHTHKYHKLNGLWFCAFDDCTHYMPKNVAPSILGKGSICWSCAKEFKLNQDALEMQKPTCDDCRTEINSIEEFIKTKESAVKPNLKDIIKDEIIIDEPTNE